MRGLGTEQAAHVLQRAAAGLRQVGEEEHPRERGDAGEEEEGAADGDGLGQRQEGHGDHAAGQAVYGHAERAAQRAHVQREDLRAVHPRNGAEADGEEGDVGHDAKNAQHDGPGDLLVRVVADDSEPRGEADEGDDHATHARQQQRPPADAVEEEGSYQDEDCLGGPDGHGGAEDAVVACDSRALEHARAVEHDGVDARRLLEEVDADSGDEDVPHSGGRGEDELLPHTLLLRASRVVGHGDHVAV
ncbi:unnamed protein product [Alopecurus aequalis]